MSLIRTSHLKLKYAFELGMSDFFIQLFLLFLHYKHYIFILTNQSNNLVNIFILARNYLLNQE